ncbi:succinylglutamate desuccinylase/aspartoacylase family protein [Pollutimonas sp. H1-120]|uniref:succinylglutamate desuccinylase/aspartoacylase family protein n=1 Tax=Pollutimonas sp. H1-120 TaxID=3148824 RepID=UPI003B51ED41
MQTTLWTTLDFEKPGKQIGTVNLPYSPNDDAYGFIPIPIAIIGNGDGPTVLITGGIHGDEYEGPVVLGDLIRDIQPDKMNGRLIILPCANAPAVSAGARTSPIDQRNMAREFPGRHNGSTTEQITAYIHDILFPLADYYMDLHAGGCSLIIEHSTLLFPDTEGDPAINRKSEEMARAFGAPTTVVASYIGQGRTPVASAGKFGIPGISAELGISGWISPDGVKLARDGVARVLSMLGVLPNNSILPPQASRMTRILGHDSYVLSPGNGYFEPAFKLMDRVSKGEIAGRLHQLLQPELDPIILRFDSDGWVWSHRSYGRTHAGSALAVLIESI